MAGQTQGLGFFDNMSIPSEFTIPTVAIDTPITNTPTIDGGGFNIDMQGIGTLASVLGGIMSSRDDKKYKEEILKREDERIARNRAQQDKFNASMSQAYA